MKNQIKQLSKHSIIFSAASLLNGTIGFLLVPVYTRYLTPSDYGKLELLNATLCILVILATQGINAAFFRTYVFLKSEFNKSIAELVSTSYFYMLFSALFFSILLFAFSNKYSQMVFGEASSSTVFVRIIAITIFFQVINIMPFQLLRAEMASVKYVSISLVGFLTNVIANLILVVVFKLGVKGVLIGNAMAVVLVTAISYFIIKKYLIFSMSKTILKELITYGYPLILAGLSLWVIQMSDRFLLQKLASGHEVGLYSLGARFATVLTVLLIMPFQAVWEAYRFQIAVKDDGKAIIRTITTFFFLTMCIVGQLIILWSPVAIKFMTGKSFWDAKKVILPLVYTNISYGLLLICVFGMVFSKKTKHLSLIICLGSIINILANFILIPLYGMVGAALASFFSYILMNVLSYRFSQKNYFIPFDMVRLLKIVVIFIIFSVMSVLFNFQILTVDIIFRIILMISFLGCFVIFKFFNDQEIDFVRNMFNQLRSCHGIPNKIRFAYELISK